MKRLLLAIISIVNVLVAEGQDTTVYKQRVITPYIYWDYGKTATLWTSFEQKSELGAGLLLFQKIKLSGEYGTSNLNPRRAFENIDYEVKGSYYRMGLGYIGFLDPKNRIGLEVLYASSDFTDRGIIQYITDEGFNDSYQRVFERANLTANWTEFNLVSQRYITLDKNDQEAWLNKLLAFGVKIRYRMLINATNVESIPDYYAIPGYGRANTSNIIALNLFLRASF